MNENGSTGKGFRIAKILSVIFHPLIIPVYGMTIVLTAPTLYSYIPFEVKKLIILIILINNVLLPLSLVPFFVHRGIIGSWDIKERKDRSILLMLVTFLYLITSYIHLKFPVPGFIKIYFLSVTFLSLAATLINFSWNISVHSIGAGALFALVVMLSVRMYTPLTWFLIPVIILGGILMSAVLSLGRHNSSQAWAGYLAGFAGFVLAISVFQKFF
jgi:hypothetical protein